MTFEWVKFEENTHARKFKSKKVEGGPNVSKKKLAWQISIGLYIKIKFSYASLPRLPGLMGMLYPPPPAWNVIWLVVFLVLLTNSWLFSVEYFNSSMMHVATKARPSCAQKYS